MLPWLIGAAIVGLVAAVSNDNEKKEKEAEERAERRRAEKAAEERAEKEMALKQASKLREVRTQISALLDSAVESLDSLYEVSLDNRFSDEEFSSGTIEKTGNLVGNHPIFGGVLGASLGGAAQNHFLGGGILEVLYPERGNHHTKGKEFCPSTIEKIRNISDKEVFEDKAIESVLQTSIQNDLMFFQEALGGKLKSTRKLQNRCEAIRELEKEKADIAKLLVAITNKAVQLSS